VEKEGTISGKLEKDCWSQRYSCLWRHPSCIMLIKDILYHYKSKTCKHKMERKKNCGLKYKGLGALW